VLLGTGDFFGEMALLSGQPRAADVIAQTYCRLLELRKMDFDRFMANNPRAQAEITRVAATRVARNEEDDALQAK
jgi:CPA1 family monovalent cation:H+ antiporter